MLGQTFRTHSSVEKGGCQGCEAKKVSNIVSSRIVYVGLKKIIVLPKVICTQLDLRPRLWNNNNNGQQ